MDNDTITIREMKNNNKIPCVGEVYYIPILGFKELAYISDSFEVAYIIGLCYKYLGANSVPVFTKMICRILGIKSIWNMD